MLPPNEPPCPSPRDSEPPTGPFKRKFGLWLRVLLRAGLGLGLVVVALFYWNGSSDSWRTPESGTTLNASKTESAVLTVMAWNIAKCDFHRGGLDFQSKRQVYAHLDKLAAVIRDHDVDLLFLSEVVYEAFPYHVNQVAYLADKAGFTHWCYGDNYSFGIPGARIRSGNAMLSKFPLQGLRVDALPGQTSIWNPTGQRRLPWATAQIGRQQVLLGSVRNDSFDLENNARQVLAILEELPDSPVMLGGDFNAEPGDESMEWLKRSGHWRGVFQGPATFPARAPQRRIDSVLIPSAWLGDIRHRVLNVDLSDHEPVVVTVPLP